MYLDKQKDKEEFELTKENNRHKRDEGKQDDYDEGNMQFEDESFTRATEVVQEVNSERLSDLNHHNRRLKSLGSENQFKPIVEYVTEKSESPSTVKEKAAYVDFQNKLMKEIEKFKTYLIQLFLSGNDLNNDDYLLTNDNAPQKSNPSIEYGIRELKRYLQGTETTVENDFDTKEYSTSLFAHLENYLNYLDGLKNIDVTKISLNKYQPDNSIEKKYTLENSHDENRYDFIYEVYSHAFDIARILNKFKEKHEEIRSYENIEAVIKKAECIRDDLGKIYSDLHRILLPNEPLTLESESSDIESSPAPKIVSDDDNEITSSLDVQSANEQTGDELGSGLEEDNETTPITESKGYVAGPFGHMILDPGNSVPRQRLVNGGFNTSTSDVVESVTSVDPLINDTSREINTNPNGTLSIGNNSGMGGINDKALSVGLGVSVGLLFFWLGLIFVKFIRSRIIKNRNRRRRERISVEDARRNALLN